MVEEGSQGSRKLTRLLEKPNDHHSILITDADAEMRGRLMAMLEPEGFSVYEASAGREAVELARQRVVDILILNMLLPDADGPNTLRLIRRMVEPPPCIFIGRQVSKEMRMQAMMAEAFAILEEPFEEEVLRGTVRRLVYRYFGPPMWPFGHG